MQIGALVDGKYKILNQIGQGGMSVVYLAMNERANKQWAIKEVRRDGVENFEMIRQGLLQETDLLKKLKHPNLPSIVDVIDQDGTLLIVMDYIEGVPLERVLQEEGAQKQEDVLTWAKQLCDVLDYLHSREPPIIYRDMKPSNIMLKPDGNVMLIDFGTAREFKEAGKSDTVCLGTRGYAAPEQYGGKGQTDARTDIYCLGAALYHLLTGHNPSEPPYEMYPIRYWRAELSSGLEEIIAKCTQNNPQDRYASCQELLYALEHYHELEGAYKRKQKQKWRTFLVLCSLTVLTGIGTLGFSRAEQNMTKNTYEACLETAENLALTDQRQCVESYKNAIALNPGKGEAYEQLLHFFLWQSTEELSSSEQMICVFSESEEQEMRKALGAAENARKTNEDFLKENPKDYEKFAYDLGIAYFYSYNGNGNKAAARKWLEIAAKAADDGRLTEREIERAKKLSKIANYYDSLGIRNQAGDSKVSYWDYWNDLADMSAQEDMDRESNVNLLLLYKEKTAQIVANAASFREAGITKQQMEEETNAMQESLKYMKIISGTANAAYEQEMKETVTRNLKLAEKIIHSTFSEVSNTEGGA